MFYTCRYKQYRMLQESLLAYMAGRLNDGENNTSKERQIQDWLKSIWPEDDDNLY